MGEGLGVDGGLCEGVLGEGLVGLDGLRLREIVLFCLLGGGGREEGGGLLLGGGGGEGGGRLRGVVVCGLGLCGYWLCGLYSVRRGRCGLEIRPL